MEIIRAIKDQISDLRELASRGDSQSHTTGRIYEKLIILSRMMEELDNHSSMTSGQGGQELELTSDRENEIIKICLEYALDNKFILGEQFNEEEVKRILEDLGD